MADSCKQQQERVEETVVQPVEQWVQQQEQRCRNEPCNWWMLCLNKVFCWIVAVLVKVCVWVLTVVVRWVYRTVCTAVMIVVGILALFVGDTSILVQAVRDLWELVKDAFYTITGAIIFVALRIVDIVQSVFGIQQRKRRLTKREREVLLPIFGESFIYDLFEIVDGPAGLLTISGRPFTMGYTVYLPNYSEQTLVHECVHTWQFLAEGFKYIGNSTFNQLDSMAFSPGYEPYAWRSRIDAGESWYTLKSAEAQASFIEDVYASGRFDFDEPGQADDTTAGAFFRSDAGGHNVFTVAGTNYTKQANDAWHIIRMF